MDIHRCRFVPYNPQAINALAFSHPPSADLAGRGVPTLRLAVGRANGDIEIWNPLRGAWFQETVLRGGKDRSIEGLAWTLDPSEDGPDGTKLPGRLRLFSIGYSTTVTEWDLEQGRPLRHSSGNYGEIWCIATQPRWQAVKRGKDGKMQTPSEGEFTGQHLAAGCADGSIVILSTADNDLKYLRLMRPSTKRARVLSVTFQNRNTIVAGYADSSIRLFDIRSGQLLRTISLGRGPAGGNKELLVWSVKCLPDGTIVSADSAGEIRFWDAKNYSLIQRIQGHLADALDVAVSANGDTVISGGADQRTVVYRKKEGEKGDKRSRWAEVMHRRYHTHDVKTFAVYETKDISIAVSGGPDAAPVVLPLREFGKEHHRKLSSLPQIPQVSSSASSRLLMSFWDREVSIWRISKGPTAQPAKGPDGQKHRLVGKVLIQGEENITSAMLSSDGKLLAVSTISSVKLFSVRRRKGDERGTLRIQKLDVPSGLSDDGARLVTISRDSRWLCVVRPNSDIYLARIEPASAANERPSVLPTIPRLNRQARHARYEKTSHGSLGDYDRTIRCVVFSDDSKMLASGDLSGCVDTWTLRKATDSEPATSPQTNGVADSEEDSEEEDEDEAAQVIDGESWRLACPETPIPRSKSGVILLSFRPTLLHGGASKRTQSTPSSSSSAVEKYRLMVLTSEHQLIEFDATDGKLTDWSRRNPKAYLPAEFRRVKDRAMGCVWDLFEGRERLWLYGTSWLWMFDLAQDFPSPDDTIGTGTAKGTNVSEAKPSSSSSHKRKRGAVDEDEDGLDGHYSNGSDGMVGRKPNTGAGDRIPRAQADVSLGNKLRKVVGKDDGMEGEWVSFEKKTEKKKKKQEEEEEDAEVDETYEYDDLFTTVNEQNIARLRRSQGGGGAENNNDDDYDRDHENENKETTGSQPLINHTNGTTNTNTNASGHIRAAQSLLHPAHRQWWHTYKYRDILGIVPLSDVLPGGVSIDYSGEADAEEEADINRTSFEVAIVERPMWDVELPGRYVRDYE